MLIINLSTAHPGAIYNCVMLNNDPVHNISIEDLTAIYHAERDARDNGCTNQRAMLGSEILCDMSLEDVTATYRRESTVNVKVLNKTSEDRPTSPRSRWPNVPSGQTGTQMLLAYSGPGPSADFIGDIGHVSMQNQFRISEFTINMHTMPKLNTSLCGFTKMYEDQGYDLHIVHTNKPKFTAPPGFTGAFHPQTGAMVPMFKEKDGFWYLYYVVAQNAKEAYDRIRAGNVLKMLLDTGANFTLGDVKHNDFLLKKTKSNLTCRGAFGPAATRGDQMGELNVWVVHSKRADLPGYKEMTVNHPHHRDVPP